MKTVKFKIANPLTVLALFTLLFSPALYADECTINKDGYNYCDRPEPLPGVSVGREVALTESVKRVAEGLLNVSCPRMYKLEYMSPQYSKCVLDYQNWTIICEIRYNDQGHIVQDPYWDITMTVTLDASNEVKNISFNSIGDCR